MDSSHYNPTYGQWNASYTSHPLTPVSLLPPLPLPPPPSHILQSQPGSPNLCGRSNQSDCHRPNYYVFSNRHDLQPKMAVSSQPSSYYSQHPSTLQQLHLPYIPEKVSFDSPMVSQPSIFSCTRSEDITQSVWVGYSEKGPDSWIMDAGRGRVDRDCRNISQPNWVGYKEKRPESWTVDAGPDRMDAARGRVDVGPSRIDDVRGRVNVGPCRNYQFDYDRPSRVCSGVSNNYGLDNTSRSRDDFESLGCVRNESGVARIKGNYQDRGQLRLEYDSRVLGEGIMGFSSSVGYGNERSGATGNLDMTRFSTTHDGAGNQGWVEAPDGGRAPFSRKRHDCHHSEVDRYFDNGRREHSSELDRMPKKQMQKKSALLRLEAPRVKPNDRENRSRHPSRYSGKRFNSFRGKDLAGHSGRGLVGNERRRTPVDLDTSFKSNVLVAKAAISPTKVGIRSGVAVTPRSSKARREMVTDKKERDSVTEGNGKLVTHASYEASIPEGSKQITRKYTAFEIEKKSDSHLTLSSSPNEAKPNKVKLVDSFGQDDKLKIIDAGPEALTCDSEAKACSTVYAAEKISSFCEAPKESNDDSNMKLCSTGEDTTDGCKSKLKSYEDELDNKGSDTPMGEALMVKVTEIVNTSLVTSPVSCPKSADIKTLSVCSEVGIPFAATSMCSGGSQPCEEEDMDGIPSRDLQMMEVNAGLQERNSISSSIRTLSNGEKDLVDKSSLDASVFSINEDTGDHVLAKSSMSNFGDDIEDANKGNNKYVDSLSYEVDPSSGLPKGLVSPASLDGVSFSRDLANATNSVSGDLANANSYIGGAYTATRVNSPDRSVVFQTESKIFSHNQVNGKTVNPSVENVSMKEFMETARLNCSAETDDILDIEEQVHVNSLSSSPTKFTVKESSNALDEDLGLSSHYPVEIPFVDQFSDSDNRGLKGCLTESNASLCKYITDGTNDSTFCDKFPRSSAFVIETNLAVENSEKSCSERVIDTESGFLETQPSSAECKLVPQDRFGCGSSGEVGSVWNPSMDKNPEKHHLRVSSCSVPDSSTGPSHFSPTVPVSEQIQNTTSMKAYCCDSQGDITPKENNSAENIKVGTQEEKINPSDVTSKFSLGHDIVAVSGDSVLPCNSLPSSPRLSFGQIQSETLVAPVIDEPNKDKGSDNEGVLLDHLQEQIVTLQGQTTTNTDVDSCGHPMSKDSGGDLVEKCNGDPIEKVTDVTSDVGSHVKYSSNSVKTDMCHGEVLSSDGKISGAEVPGDSGAHISRLHSHADVKSSLAHVKDHVVSVPLRESQSKTSLSFRLEMQKGKKKSKYATQKCYPRSLPFVSDTKKDANPPTHITKRLTWHRKSDTSASPLVAMKPLSSTLSTQQKFLKVTTQPSSNSYVRKGNNLLRKPSHGSPGISGMPPSSIRLNRLTVEDKNMGSVGRIGVDNAIFAVKTRERLTHEKQSRSASGSTSKISNVSATSSGKCALSSSMDHLTTGLPESIMDSATSGEAIVPHSCGNAIKTSDTLHHTGYASDFQQKKNPPKLDSSTFRKMVYVKKKANQLVASSDIHGAGKSQIPPTDGYFKRSVNQLVRNSESHANQAISLRDDASDSQAAAKMVSERSSISAFCNSAVVRPFKKSKFSRVWKQSDLQSGIPIVHMRYQKILPQLVPWKRVTYWRRFMNSVSNVRSGSFSNISRKLIMMRKRHTVYTRSSNGYSLRKSKVLSIGGSHLKWSKSIERDSRKANEEATLAVAAFAKKKSEKHCGQSNTGANRNHLARERIFRIGSLRYKMDSSRQTLQRISDVGSPCSGSSENGKGSKKPFIPKRLVIGNEEYVRVGSGNQLVRDPKKRTRVLANEKVRWSLHNVRLRLAKKKKYCQFFTRFGKCNKDDGKCPYIHDPSKIAVCTKFLNGFCANANCKLTHKVIPERMPDCSYFLQGLCNNEACPYRHVHVNPNAAICDGFLKGYCSDGDECRKKHTYTCPVFEATGTCPKGSKCKLHHPKKQSKGKKRKRPSEPSQKNARWRYFVSLHKDLSESEPMVLDRRATDNEVFGIQGLEFIKLDSTEYEASKGNDDGTATKQPISSDGEVLIDDLIRPVLLMQQEVL